ncbi:MFS transporter [Paramixta manurensis]|uniref:MFS transporter n=1 Tax=Paramixta manurensis TaxID=2740817 RepID=A0A6M8UFN2_9GAMM|nr:MFS transporter [Erwiniaceae bacterium PD-1]
MTPNTAMPWIMLVLGGICLRAGISSIAPMLDAIQARFHVSVGWLGLLTAIPVICMGALSTIGHRLEGRFGIKKTMVVSFLLLTIGLLLRLDINHFGLLLITAGCVGVADAVIRPLLSGFIKDKFPERIALAMSVYSASMGLGSASAAWLTPYVSEFADHHWGSGLAVWSLPALIALVIWFIGDVRPTQVAPAAATQPFSVTRAHILCFTLFFGLQAGINYVTLAWLPLFYIHMGMAVGSAGMLVAVCVIVQMITSLLLSTVTRLTGLTHPHAVVAFSLLTLVGIVLLFIPGAPFWLAPAIIGLATGGLFPLALIIPLDFTHNRQQATRLSGMTQSGGYILGGLAPWLTGLLSQWLGINLGFRAFLLFCALAVIVISLLVAKAYQTRDAERSATKDGV